MKNKTVSLTLFLTLSFILMLSASYLSNIQDWLKFNQHNSQHQLNQVVVMPADLPSGIRLISSVSASSRSFSSPDSKSSDSSYHKTASQIHEVSKLERLPQMEPPSVIDSPSLLTNKGGEKKHSYSLSPVFIQYEDALVIEFPKALASQARLKRAINQVLLSPFKVTNRDLLSTKSIPAQQKPWFYQQVKNQYGRPIRYPADANDYAEYLLREHTTEVEDTDGVFVVIQIPLVKLAILDQVIQYKPWVDRYTTRFDVPKDLVFAIMEVESAFNPKAVSQSNALGLMQIKAAAAGRDVYQYVDGKTGQPSAKSLFDAQNNIRMGIAYLGLLKHDYLQGVRNPESKEMLSIASYNGGISRTLKLFGETPDEAIVRVNRLHPKRVYRILRYEHTSSEARLYLDKVLQAKKRYSELLDLNV